MKALLICGVLFWAVTAHASDCYAPPQLSISPAVVSIHAGESVVLRCRIHNPDPPFAACDALLQGFTLATDAPSAVTYMRVGEFPTARMTTSLAPQETREFDCVVGTKRSTPVGEYDVDLEADDGTATGTELYVR